MSIFSILKAVGTIIGDAISEMSRDDGFAIASHVALSSLLALFPFLIFIAALTGFLGLGDMADRIAEMLFDAWPKEVAGPISREITVVLTEPRGDFLTVGVVASVWFASNGVEAYRVALNRAYREPENRGFIYRRLQAIALVLIGSAILITFAFLIVFAPLVWTTVLKYAPFLEEFTARLNLSRYLIASVLTLMGLFVAHFVLPAGRRGFFDVLPGVLATLVLWMVSGVAFGIYLAGFANYVSTYAGLAGVMTALIFLYLVSMVFVLGGELNAATLRWRRRRAEASASAA